MLRPALYAVLAFTGGLGTGVFINLLTNLVDRQNAVRDARKAGLVAVLSMLGAVATATGLVDPSGDTSFFSGQPTWLRLLLVGVCLAVAWIYWTASRPWLEGIEARNRLKGVEASFDFDGPANADDDLKELGRRLDDASHIFRVGLRSLDRDRSYMVHVDIVAISGGAEGGTMERRLRFKDSPLDKAEVHYDPNGACVYVDVLEIPILDSVHARIPYAKKQEFGGELKVTSQFVVRLRIVGGPRTIYANVTFGPIEGKPMVLPFVTQFEVED
jgi:hypothetical protein